MKSFFILLIAFCLLPFNVTQAASPLSVVINEIAWMGTKASSADEWVEFFNTASEAISLDEWGLFEAGGVTQIITLSGAIAPGGFYLIERTDDSTISDIPADISRPFGGNGLHNSGEYLVLKDAQGNIVDQVNASSPGWFAGTASPDYFSMERKNPTASGSDPSNWASNNGITRNGLDANGNPMNGTPKTQNSGGESQPPPPPPEPQPIQEPIPTAPPLQTYPSGIFVNEFLPAPEGSDSEEEFIELSNSNSFSVDLSNWTIEDTKGSIKVYIFPDGTALGNYGFFVLWRPASKIVLNNDGEGLILKNPLGDIVHSVAYEGQAPKGQSYARKNSGDLEWSISPTPGKENNFPAPEKIEAAQPASQQSQSQTSQESQIRVQSESAAQSQFSEESEESERKTYLSGVFINEILPSPTGPDTEEEWIEILNSNNFEVDLTGWKIQDTVGAIKVYTFPAGTKISPLGFLVLTRQTSKITLNNDGDGLQLINPNGDIVDEVSYGKALKGQSYNKIPLESKPLTGQAEVGWVWSESPTPGASNSTSQPQGEEYETAEFSEKGLAAIGKQIPEFPQGFVVFFAALGLAIFSGAIIFVLKKKLKAFRPQ